MEVQDGVYMAIATASGYLVKSARDYLVARRRIDRQAQAKEHEVELREHENELQHEKVLYLEWQKIYQAVRQQLGELQAKVESLEDNHRKCLVESSELRGKIALQDMSIKHLKEKLVGRGLLIAGDVENATDTEGAV